MQKRTLSDATLVRRAQRGSPAAFGALFERHFDAIYTYLRLKTGDPYLAEDLTSDTFLKALGAIASYRDTGVSFRAWLFRIAHNAMVDHLRRTARRVEVPLDASADERPGGDDPTEGLAVLAERQQVRRAVRGLTDLQRRVLVLKYWSGLNNAAVAATLDRTVASVKALQHAALVSLRRQLSAAH